MNPNNLTPTQQPIQSPQSQQNTPQQQPVQQAPTQTESGLSKPGQAIAVIGLILAIILPPIGVVVSFIAKSKAKTTGTKSILAVVGIIIGSILSLVILIIFIFGFLSGTQMAVKEKAYDNERRIDVKFLGNSVKQYVQQTGKFPETLDDLKDVQGINQEDLEAAIIDPKGFSYSYGPTPAGCTNEAKTCTGYQVYAVSSTGQTIEDSDTLAPIQ